jgi:DNA-binding beta-propeller fold protein YncE
MRRFALVLVGVLAVSCASPRARAPVVWPSPPDPPRVRFVTAFRNGADLDDSRWASFKRALFGGGNDVQLRQPMGLALSDDGTRLYIADYGLGHVVVADLRERSLAVFAVDEPMGKPFAVALDADENLYVSNSAGHEVLVFSRRGDRLLSIGQRDLERPTGVAVDRQRRLLYVADSASRLSDKHRVLVFDLGGKLLGQLGSTQGATKGDGDGQFYFPTYLALDSAGNLHVADTMNFRIQKFDPQGRFLAKFGENGDTAGHFSRLKGLAFDAFGNLYVVDGGHSNVQLFNTRFEPLMFFGGYAQKLEYFDIPSGIAIDPRTNSIYVCNEFIARINVYELFNTTAEDSLQQRSTAAAGEGRGTKPGTAATAAAH